MRDGLLRIQQRIGVRLATARLMDRGAVTTETAVVTFLLVGAAVIVVGVLSGKATDWAEAIPNP